MNYKTCLASKICFATILSFFVLGADAQRDWQKVTLPKVSQMEEKFKNYPSEYAHTLTWGWDGPVTRETIAKDLDAIYGQGLRVVTIEAGYNMANPYLSPGWFETIKVAVEEAKKRDMRIWIIDEGKYPSGFAGGKFSQERPDLRMQGLVVAQRIPATEGQEISRKLSAGIISAVAVNQADRTNKIIDVSSGTLNWKAPQGNWQIILAQHRFKTSVTRAANNTTHGKDTVNSLCDYLNPDATRQFLQFTHEQYKKYIGNEFGKTVMGFRGDEPDYGFTPWTPKMPEEFQKRKGYNIIPYLASFFSQSLTDEQKRAKADYWDVWSDLFGENFFDVQAEWCANNNLEYMVHLNHEEKMMDLVRSSGDFFKNMRHVQVPGVDAIWNQVWPDKVADFPKLASSAAHLFGRPRALSESFAAYNTPPTVAQAKWCVDYQMVRGINLFEYMFWSGSAGGGRGGMPKSYLGQPEFPKLADYSNRAAYLLAHGKPAAKIALYHPTSSMWLGDEESNKSVLSIAQGLSERQYDYDFVDEQALSSVLKLEKGMLKNLSDQSYSMVIIPSVSVLSSKTFDRLKTFAKAGGKVIFLGKSPSNLADRTFLNMTAAPQMAGAVYEPSGELNAKVIAMLPQDVKLSKPAPAVKYLHHSWQDAEMYFFFNEGDTPQDLIATLNGKGAVNIWNAETGVISKVSTPPASQNTVKVPLMLNPHETRFLVINSK